MTMILRIIFIKIFWTNLTNKQETPILGGVMQLGKLPIDKLENVNSG